MKRIILSILILIPILIQGCYVETEGPPGPSGFNGQDGRDGQDGENGLEAFVFEYEFTFNRTDYREILSLPDDFQMLESDVALVYFLWEVDDNDNEIWRLLPQNIFTPEGLLQYNFDFTRVDASVFLDAEFNLDNLGPSYLDDWIARVVVVPGNFNGRMDFTDYNAVKEAFDLKDIELDISDYKQKPE